MTYTNDLIASVLGYPEETGDTPAVPQPDVLGSDGSYVALRKLHQRVTAFREYLRTNSADSEQEEWIAAKMMGRCRSGAPPTVCPCTTTLSLVRIHTANEGSFFGQPAQQTPSPAHWKQSAHLTFRSGGAGGEW